MNGNGNGNRNDNDNGAQYPSRKWSLILLVVIVATIAAFLPPIISAWLLGAAKPLVILTGTEWVSIVTLSVSAYFGANVWQKYVQRRQYQFDPEASGVYGGDDENVSEDEEDNVNKEA